MKKNKFIIAFLLMFFMLFYLTSCQSTETKDAVVEYKITEDNKVNYKVYLTNQTIYNYNDVYYEVAVFKDGEVIEKMIVDVPDFSIEHNKTYVADGTFSEIDTNFDSIEVINFKYTVDSFYNTYLSFIILMPIISIVLSGIVFYILYRGEPTNGSNSVAGRTSVIGLIGLMAMLAMINYVGWVSILFMYGCAAVIFLSGLVAVKLKKKKYVPSEVLENRNIESIQNSNEVQTLIEDNNDVCKSEEDSDKKEGE